MSSNTFASASPPLASRSRATACGLALALLGGPAYLALYRLITGENHSDTQIVLKELGLFLLVAVLLWLVKTREALPLSSIDLHLERMGRSLLRECLLAVAALVVTVGLYFLLRQFGIHLGGSDSFRYRDLVANITGHFLEDFVLNVGLPLVSGG